MKKVNLSVFICLLLSWCMPVSANSFILPEVLDLSRTSLTQASDKLIVVPRDGVSLYLFAEFPVSNSDSDSNNNGNNGNGNDDNDDDKKKAIADYVSQLEKTNWKKFDMGSFVEFEKQHEGCPLLLQIIDTAHANRILISSKDLPDGIYFNLIPSESCNQDKYNKTITAQFSLVEVFTQELADSIKPPAQPYGATRQASQIPTYSESLSLSDLIDFDSHLSLDVLKACHTESLFSADHASKIGCFSEDRSTYPSYTQLDEYKIYDSEPYISSRAGSFFRKQGFQTIQSDSKEAQAGIKYYKASYSNKNLPNLADVGFVTAINPEGCNILAWLFIAKQDSPLWQGVAFKSIKVQREDGDIHTVKIYEKQNYLVSFAPSEGCK